jgi:hypothetical protein
VRRGMEAGAEAQGLQPWAWPPLTVEFPASV